MQEPEEHPGREYLLWALSLIVEFLAWTYGLKWLTWFAVPLLWLSVFNYTEIRASGPS